MTTDNATQKDGDRTATGTESEAGNLDAECNRCGSEDLETKMTPLCKGCRLKQKKEDFSKGKTFLGGLR